MVEVIPALRKSAVLAPSSLACLADIATINLTLGCAHACRYCYARGYSSYPGDGRVVLYTNTLEKLRGELARKRIRPRAFYFSPSCDLFQPVTQVREVAYQVLEYLLDEGIGIAFLTKGVIPDKHLALLCRHAPLVRAQIGITTLNATLAQTIEPYAAPPAQRLVQLRGLLAAGIDTHARLDPILPGLTDGDTSLDTLCAALAAGGVRQLAASTLFLRPAITQALRRALPSTLLTPLIHHYTGCSHLGIHAAHSVVSALPQPAREAIYTRLHTIAAGYGMTVRVCSCKNPDIAAGTCRIAGQWEGGRMRKGQLGLFGE